MLSLNGQKQTTIKVSNLETKDKNTGFGVVVKVLKNCTKTLIQTLKSYEFCGILKNKTKLTTMNCMLSYLKSLEMETLYSFFFFYIQPFSLTECIVIIGVRKYRVVCLSVCVCVSVCLSAPVWQNYWADFNETFQKWSLAGLCVRVCV